MRGDPADHVVQWCSRPFSAENVNGVLPLCVKGPIHHELGGCLNEGIVLGRRWGGVLIEGHVHVAPPFLGVLGCYTRRPGGNRNPKYLPLDPRVTVIFSPKASLSSSTPTRHEGESSLIDRRWGLKPFIRGSPYMDVFVCGPKNANSSHAHVFCVRLLQKKSFGGEEFHKHFPAPYVTHHSAS